jgi:hypothetical protein
MPTKRKAATTRKAKTPSRISLFGPPPLIEGEDAAAYDELYARVSSAVRPTDFIEELLLHDVVDISWSIYRLRRLQAALLSDEISREFSREVAFLDELIETTPEDEHKAALLTRKANVDANKIQATTIVRHLETIERIEHLIAIAESRRNATLHEIEHHRAAFAHMLRDKIREVENAEFVGPQETVAADIPQKEAA